MAYFGDALCKKIYLLLLHVVSNLTIEWTLQDNMLSVKIEIVDYHPVSIIRLLWCLMHMNVLHSVQIIYHDSNRPLIHVESSFAFQWKGHLNKLSSIACDLTIIPNIQILEDNDLATIQRAKLKGAYVVQ